MSDWKELKNELDAVIKCSRRELIFFNTLIEGRHDNTFKLSNDELENVVTNFIRNETNVKGLMKSFEDRYKKCLLDESDFSWLDTSITIDCYYIWYQITKLSFLGEYYSFNTSNKIAYLELRMPIDSQPKSSEECKEFILLYFDCLEKTRSVKIELLALLKNKLYTFKTNKEKCFKMLKQANCETAMLFWNYLIKKDIAIQTFTPLMRQEFIDFSIISLCEQSEQVIAKAYSNLQSQRSYNKKKSINEKNIKIGSKESKQLVEIANAYGVDVNAYLKNLINEDYSKLKS